jgi:hypothetical protein
MYASVFALGALVFYAVSLEFLGFIVASAITLVFILRFAERYSWLATLARWLCRYGTRREEVKAGIALLGVSGTETDVALITRLGLLEELTDHAFAAFKDLLKSWGMQHDLVFIPEYKLDTLTRDKRYVDGALLYELRVPFGPP